MATDTDSARRYLGCNECDRDYGPAQVHLLDDRFEVEFLLHVGVTEREERIADLVVGVVEIGALMEVGDPRQYVPLGFADIRQ